MTVLSSTKIHSQYFGKTTYSKSMEIQANALNQILGFEYEPTITLGKRAGQDEIKSFKGFEVFTIDRGGFATLHSPGQLVIYPVLDIRSLKLSVRDYVESLEATTCTFLDGLGIQTIKGDESGVFTETGKIAFIGIRVREGITQHGISINISNDLHLFESIRPCGVSKRCLDSVQNHGLQLPLDQAFRAWSEIFTANMAH